MTNTNLIFRGATVFTPDGRKQVDVRVEDGRIADIGSVSAADAQEVACEGKWLLPGAVDGHVHFRDPGAPHKEDFESGSAAAVAGGVTTVFDMPNTSPTTTTVERLEAKREVATQKSHCNWGLFFGANPTNLEEARRATNVAGLKIFMGCSTGDLLVYLPEDLEPIFAGYEGRICVHAESELRLREREEKFMFRDDPAVHSEIRDDQCAVEAVELAATLAREHDRHLHVLHLSTRDELDALARIGGNTTCEVCPHHLFWDTNAYAEHGTFARMNPPLRSPAQRESMWEALADGRIDMVATDHAPHTLQEKSRTYREAPSGVPGVETMLPMMLDAASWGLCSEDDVVEWLCHAPARVYGIRDRHRIEVGCWADLVVVDPELRRVVRNEEQFTRCAWSPWAGREITGWPIATYVNGVLAFQRDGAEPGRVHDTRGSEVLFEAG